jgi:hypothetical protein
MDLVRAHHEIAPLAHLGERGQFLPRVDAPDRIVRIAQQEEPAARPDGGVE